jgi:type IV secretory pathway VirB2 component (pilin)
LFSTGPVAMAISTLLLIFLGFLIAFGEMRGFLGLFLRVSFGLTMVFSAASWISFFK